VERTSRETWTKRVERWKDSGLTAAEYAAENSVVNRPLASTDARTLAMIVRGVPKESP
jgi:hypothetical protein